CLQRAPGTTPVAAASLDADRCDREAAQLLDQYRPAGWVVRHRRGVLVGQHHHVQTILRHDDSTKREHLRIPSLLMRARALATVRGWKKRLELIRGLRSEAPADFRSRWGDGHDRIPVSPQNGVWPTYKAPRVHIDARRRGSIAADIR